MLDRVIDLLLSRCDSADLTRLHVALALIGGLLAVYVANLTSYERDDAGEPATLQWARRVGYYATAMALFWSVVYMDNHRWQPWPPMLLLMAGIVVMLAARAGAIWLRIRREGRSRREAEIMVHKSKPETSIIPM